MTLAADNHLKGNRSGPQKVLALAIFLTLAGCSGGDHLADVRGFMKDVTARPVPSIKPLPEFKPCLLYTSPSPRDATLSRMPSSA